MPATTSEVRYLVREGLVWRDFADGTVIHHPDTGDTILFESFAGNVLVGLQGAGRFVSAAELLSALTPSERAIVADDAEQLQAWLDELELRDFVRADGR